MKVPRVIIRQQAAAMACNHRAITRQWRRRPVGGWSSERAVTMTGSPFTETANKKAGPKLGRWACERDGHCRPATVACRRFRRAAQILVGFGRTR